MTRRKKRAIVVAVVAGLALIAAIAGYAYWTTTGSGTGSSTAGTTSADHAACDASRPGSIREARSR